MVVITSLWAGYCGEEILHLYRSRWQVELLFKRFKQNFSVTSLKSGNKSYAETEVLLWLIIWAISERQLFLAECFLAGKGETVNCSLYEKCKISFLKIKEILCLPWGQFINFTDKKYSRYLSRKKLYRKNQNNEFHTAILPGLLACSHLLVTRPRLLADKENGDCHTMKRRTMTHRQGKANSCPP